MLGTEERIKRYLERATRLDKQITALHTQLDNLKTDEARAARLSDLQGAAELHEANAALRKALLASLARFSKTKRSILRVLEHITADDVRLVMTERYMNGKTWEAIAEDNAYSLSTVYRMHKKGLLAAELLLPANRG